MAFDFPEAPAVDDVFTAAGIEYIWDGSVWNMASGGDMQDYVLKDGDAMTVGPLETFQPAHFRANATDPIHGAVRVSGGAVGRTGMVEFIKDKAAAGDSDLRLARFGWGTPTEIEFAFENGCTGLRMIGGGIHIGSDSAQTDKYNFNKGICLYGYGGTSQFGFTITSGTLNYCVQNEGNKHEFWCGSKKSLVIEDMEIRPLNKMLGQTTTDGLNGYFIGDSWHGMCFNGSNALQFIEYHAKWQFVRRTTGTTGGTIIYLIDDVGSSGNSVSVTAPESIALAAELGVETDDERGVDVMKVVALLAAKIKLMELEIAALKAAK
jgi:hypothetical protein